MIFNFMKKYESILNSFDWEINNKDIPADIFNSNLTKTYIDFNKLLNSEIVELYIKLKNMNILDIYGFDCYMDQLGRKVPELFDLYYSVFKDLFILNKIQNSKGMQLFELKARIPEFFKNVLEDNKLLIETLKNELANIEDQDIKILIKNKIKELK